MSNEYTHKLKLQVENKIEIKYTKNNTGIIFKDIPLKVKLFALTRYLTDKDSECYLNITSVFKLYHYH